MGGVSILMACGQVPGAPGKEATPGEKPAAAKPAEAPKKEVKTVTFWYTNFDPWNFDTQPLPKALRAEFDQTSGYTLEPIIKPNGGFDEIPTVVAAGAAPDISKTQSYIQPQWGVLGLVRPLDDYMKTAKNIPVNELWPEKYKAMVYGGKTYGLSYSIDTRVIYLNVEQYLQAGLDPAKPPATWDAMDEAIIKTHKMSGNDIARLAWDPYRGSGGVHTWMVPYWQLGGEVISADKTKFTVNNELAVRALTWHKKVIDAQGGWAKFQAFHKDKRAEEQFGQGLMTHCYFTNATRTLLKPFSGLKYDVATYPQPPGGGRPASYSGDWAFCLPFGSKNPDGAFAWIDFMYRSDVNLKWSLEMDRIPVRKSVAESEQYIQGDKLRKLAIQDMGGARFVVSVPGAGDILPITSQTINNIMEGKATIPEALREFEARAQKAMDDFLAKVKK